MKDFLVKQTKKHELLNYKFLIPFSKEQQWIEAAIDIHLLNVLRLAATFCTPSRNLHLIIIDIDNRYNSLNILFFTLTLLAKPISLWYLFQWDI